MIRAATTRDLEEVASWISTPREAELWAGWRVIFPIQLESLPAQIEFSDTNAFCLLAPDRLVAFGQLVAKDAQRGHLARIVVRPEARKRGYGETLVQGLLDVARLRRFERVSLNVDEANAAAVALYRKLGFADAPRPPKEPVSAGTLYLERPA